MLNDELHGLCREYGERIGAAMATQYEPVPHMDEEGQQIGGLSMIPGGAVEDISDGLSTLIAEVIAWFLNAGSEREVTLEELGPVIAEHLRGWSDQAPGYRDNEPLPQYTEEEYGVIRQLALNLKSATELAPEGSRLGVRGLLLTDLSRMMDEGLDEF